MKNTKTFHVILFCLLSFFLNAQQVPNDLIPEFIDYNVCSSSTSSSIQQVISSGNCTSISNDGHPYDSKFIPSSTQPILYVRTNFIFLQRADGTGNFQENNSEHQSLLNDFITKMNYTYSNMSNPNAQSCYTGSDFVPDARIQFIVNKIYMKDNYGWNNRHDNRGRTMCPEYSDWYLNYLDNQIVANPNIPRGINIYFTEDSINYRNLIEVQDSLNYYGAPYACSQFPSYYDYNRTSKIHMPDVYSKYWFMKNIIPTRNNQPWDPVVRFWETDGVGSTLAHEIGHSLWLGHESPYYGYATCFYTIMNPAGAAPHNYLPPSEIGRIYAALSLTNLRTFVPNDTYLGCKDISTVEVWNNMRLYQSLNITSTGQMTFPCNITMPYQANIQVSGLLTIDNSNINSIQNDWGGITVKSGGLLVLNGTSISDYNITVEAGGSLIIKGSLVMSGNHAINVQSGGYLCVETGTTVQLTDYNSVIKIGEGSLNGVNPALSVSSSCISNPSAIIPAGNGAIADFNQDVYIQNLTISASRYIGGKKSLFFK